MNSRCSLFANSNELSFKKVYSTTLNTLKSLSKLEEIDKSEQDEYLSAHENLLNLNNADIEGMFYTVDHTNVKNALHKRLLCTPLEEKHLQEIITLENGLLFLEQCSPRLRHCLNTNEGISSDNKISQFVFINECGLSQTGMSQLMMARKKYEDSEVGLREALREITHNSLKHKVDNITPRDIVRLRLYIEENYYFAPTFHGMIYGLMLGGLASSFILYFATLSLPLLVICSFIPSVIGIIAGLKIEKALVKSELRDTIGHVSAFSFAPSLYLLLNNEKTSCLWCSLFCCRTRDKETPTVSLVSTPKVASLLSSP